MGTRIFTSLSVDDVSKMVGPPYSETDVGENSRIAVYRLEKEQTVLNLVIMNDRVTDFSLELIEP